MPIGIYVRTKENSGKNKGKHWNLSDEQKLHLSKINKGKIVSEQTKKKISFARKGKILNGKLGTNQSEETKKKISKANKGTKHSEERIRQQSEIMFRIAKKGNENPRWKGGYENTKLLNRNRLILKKKNGGSHTSEEWELLKKKYKLQCAKCKRKEPEIKLTRDHIIPVSKGGSDNIGNIQPLCRSCNSKKHNNEEF